MLSGYPSSKTQEKIVVIFHIYGAVSIFLQFYNHQDIEYDQSKIQNSSSWPISTQKKEKKYIYGTTMSIIYKMRENNRGNYSYVWIQMHYFVITTTPNPSNVKYKLACLKLCSHRKYIIKATCDQDIHPLQYGRNKVLIIHVFYFVITKTPNLSNVKYKLVYPNQY